MKITIEIPPEFEGEFKLNRFKDTFKRVLADVLADEHYLVGNYEIETIEMLIEAFKKADFKEENKMKDKNPLFDELKYYMEQIEEEYYRWFFPDNAYRENRELLLRLYEEKFSPQALDILTRYNRFLCEILK